MRKIAFSQIYHLSFEYPNPERANRLMRDYLKSAMKLTMNTLTKDLILKFRNAKVGFAECERVAQNLVWQKKSGDVKRKDKYDIVKDLMKHKMKDVEECIKLSRKNLYTSKENLNL